MIQMGNNGNKKEKDNKKERELTKKELERKALFEKSKEQMKSKGYICRNQTIGVTYANGMSLVMAIPFIIFFSVLYMLWNCKDSSIVSCLKSGWELIVEMPYWKMVLVYVIFIALIVFHELIHGFVWGLFAENHFRDISFGVIWSMLTPYCYCKSMIKKGEYVLGGIMPTIVLGILPSFYGVFTGNLGVLIVGLIMIIGGGGDMIILSKLLSYKSECKEVLYVDHPYECGFVVFEK